MSRRTRQRKTGLANHVRGAEKLCQSITRWTLRTGLRRLGAYGLLLVGTTSLYATHLMGGGEIELICVNSSTNPPTYRIRVRTYRDCAGPIPKTGLP